ILNQLSWKHFRLSLSGMGRFGDLLWAGADGGKELCALAEEIRERLDAAGIPYDKKAFHPHITLLRRMKGADGTRISPPEREMIVKELTLMRSDRVNGRMVYTGIYTV
ncbi:MAG: 2'-5' RNA ligase family protein, partial [Clostridia bacterium]|nr:2'-5' RNA ligase family protein [Clostridia bacterium]